MKKKGVKRKHQVSHVRRRLQERFGIHLNEHEIEHLSQSIRDHHPAGEFVERQSDRVTVWRGVMLGNEMYLVYDKDRGTVVSALTPIQWENGQKGAY